MNVRNAVLFLVSLMLGLIIATFLFGSNGNPTPSDMIGTQTLLGEETNDTGRPREKTLGK